MHHSSDVPDSALSDELKELFDDLGGTGEYPDGKIHDSDEGEIKFAVGVKDAKVVIEFGKPVAWLGMHPRQAIALGTQLRNKARRLLKGREAQG